MLDVDIDAGRRSNGGLLEAHKIIEYLRSFGGKPGARGVGNAHQPSSVNGSRFPRKHKCQYNPY